MKHYTFYRESNKFDDILKDSVIKKITDSKMQWYQHLQLGMENNTENEKVFSYIVMKYGDDLKSKLTEDYRPIPYVDYQPKRKV